RRSIRAGQRSVCRRTCVRRHFFCAQKRRSDVATKESVGRRRDLGPPRYQAVVDEMTTATILEASTPRFSLAPGVARWICGSIRPLTLWRPDERKSTEPHFCFSRSVPSAGDGVSECRSGAHAPAGPLRSRGGVVHARGQHVSG